MFAEQLIPRGYLERVPLTVEDREIIQRRGAGVMALMDRQDAQDMFLYGALRRKGMPKMGLSVGISPILDKLQNDVLEQIVQHIKSIEDGEPAGSRAPTLQ
jgi:hypothetical protein